MPGTKAGMPQAHILIQIRGVIQPKFKMMKTINLAPLSLYLMIACYSFSACSKDDVKEKPYVLITATGDIQAE
jgi:fucose permease